MKFDLLSNCRSLTSVCLLVSNKITWEMQFMTILF